MKPERRSASKTREKGKRKESRGTAGSKKMRRSPTISSRNLLIKNDESNKTKEAAAVKELSNQYFSYGENSYHPSIQDSFSQQTRIRKSESMSMQSNKVSYIPKGGLFSKNGLYRILAKEN